MTANDSFSDSLKRAFDLHNAGRHAEAEAVCRALAKTNPRDAQLLFLLGMILHRMGRDEEAVKLLIEAVEADPRSSRAFNGLGCAYQALKDHPRAAAGFARAIELEPKSADLRYSLGNVRYNMGEIELAADCYRAAVELNPQDVASWCNLGKCLQELNRVDESISVYDRALAANPDELLALYGRAISCLMAGRLREGYRDYECRWRKIPQRDFPQPVWRGETQPGKTLFLHAEQGFGDAIQNVRLVAQARERVGRVILECRPELKRLFAYSRCADVVIAHGEPIPPFDCFTSLQSLPLCLDLALETIPARVPYLRAPPFANLPPPPPRHVKVGIVWAGNPGHHDDAERSLRLEQFAPILHVPRVAFYSLQLSVPARDAELLRSTPAIVDLCSKSHDFLDTASAVAEMDLVIAVDTAVAHLAGALARPVWTLVRQPADWRWMLDRSDTPWYPTMRLFRQTQRGQWQPVIEQVAQALRSFSIPPAGA